MPGYIQNTWNYGSRCLGPYGYHEVPDAPRSKGRRAPLVLSQPTFTKVLAMGTEDNSSYVSWIFGQAEDGRWIATNGHKVMAKATQRELESLIEWFRSKGYTFVQWGEVVSAPSKIDTSVLLKDTRWEHLLPAVPEESETPALQGPMGFPDLWS